VNPYANEDVMWQRLKDLQREAENSRLFAEHGLPRLGRAARSAVLWVLPAVRWTPRRSMLLRAFRPRWWIS
jgi:hypothetical protein